MKLHMYIKKCCLIKYAKFQSFLLDYCLDAEKENLPSQLGPISDLISFRGRNFDHRNLASILIFDFDRIIIIFFYFISI